MGTALQINNGRVQRDSNIELLRSVLMYMIVLYHFILHGCGLYALMHNDFMPGSAKEYLYIAILSFTAVAVNCFVFISGYYGIKFKLRSFISLILQGVFYSLGIYLFVIAFFSIEFNPYELVKSLFPVSFTKWWFLSVYVGLYALSPIINKGLDALSKQQTMILIGILLYLEITAPFTYMNLLSDDGLSIYTLLMMYVLGRFCRMYNFELKKPLLWYFIICIVLCALVLVLTNNGHSALAWRFTWYNSLPVVLGAISLFYVFKNITIGKIAWINNIAALVFAVYLIHEDPYIKQTLYPYLNQNVFLIDNVMLFFVAILGVALLLFLFSIIIEKVRQLFFYPLEQKLFNSKMVVKLGNIVDVK